MARVLIVDDNPIDRQVLKAILLQAGHIVDEAENGLMALKCYAKAPADLVITDIFMPEKEGLETVRELKKQDPLVRIIAVSGGSSNASYDSLQWVRMFGVRHAFPKPFNREEILRAVDELLTS